VQLLIYGCNSWRVTPQVQEKLDRWVAEKMPYISDRDAEDERADPTMDVDMMVRKLRLKWLGEVLRLPEHRVIHQEVCAYAELVRRGVIGKRGSLLHDAPPFESVAHLKQQAGWLPEARLSQMPAVERAQREIMRKDWEAAVQVLKDGIWRNPEDEVLEKAEREEEEKLKKKEEEQKQREKEAEEAKGLSEEQKQQRAERALADEAEEEAKEEERCRGYAEISEAQLRTQPPGTMVGATDGGYTAAKPPQVPADKSGFGFSVHTVWQEGPPTEKRRFRRPPVDCREAGTANWEQWQMATERQRDHWRDYCMPIFRHLLKPIYYTAMLEMKRITT
jgi:hypothetical protein